MGLSVHLTNLVRIFLVVRDISHKFPFLAANVMLDAAYERIIVGDRFCDVPLGVFLIRGENVMLMGQMVICFHSQLPMRINSRIQDVQKDINQKHLTRVTIEEIYELQRTTKKTNLSFELPFDDAA